MDVRAIITVVAMLCAGTSSAQQVHKCVTSGKVVYQSAPCENGPAQKTWAATVTPPSRENEARLDAIRRQLHQRRLADQAQARNSGGGTAIRFSQHKDPYACQSAKDERDRMYRIVGHRRSFEMSRTQDDAVYEACK